MEVVNNNTSSEWTEQNATHYYYYPRFFRDLPPMLPSACRILGTFLQNSLEACSMAAVLWLIRSKLNLKLQRHLLLIATQIITASIVVPHLLAMCVPSYLWRQLVKHLLRRKYGKTPTLLKGTDAVWSLDLPECRSIINVLFVMEGKPDLEDIRRHYLEKLVTIVKPSGELMFPRLTQYREMEYGYWCWKDGDSFNIKDHVRFYDYHDISGEEPLEPNRILEMLSAVANDPFPHKKASWEVLIFPNVSFPIQGKAEDSCQYCVFHRLHHTIGDGISLARVLLTQLSDEPLPDDLIPKAPETSWIQKIFRGICIISYLPISLLCQVAGSESNALHGPKLSGSKIMATSEPVPLNTLKAIKNATNSTVTDVLMAAITASLNSYLRRRDKIVPANITGVLTVALPPPKQVRLENHFTVANITLPTATMAPLERLKVINKHSEQLKKSPEMMAIYWSLRILAKLLPSPFSRLLLDHTPSTLVVSNVPGPSRSISLWGNRLCDFLFWVPTRGNIGIGLSLLSYNGHVRAGLVVDKSVIDRREQVEEILEDWTENIRQLTTLAEGLVSDTRPRVG